MKKTTYRLAKHYKKQGKTQLAEEVIKFDLTLHKLFKPQKEKVYRTCMYDHTIKSVAGFHFHEESGECPTCHVLEEQYFDHYYDIKAEMQHSNNGRGM